MEETWLGVLAVLAIVALVSGIGFAYGVDVRSDWPTCELGFTPSEDGFYHMAWNSNGELQLAYLGSYGPYYALLYGRNLAGGWDFTCLSQLVEDHDGASLALDSKDNVYVCTHSYWGSDFLGLGPHILFATDSSGEWQVEIVNVTSYCSAAEVAVDADDNIHLLYSKNTHQVEYNQNSSIVDMVKTDEGWTGITLKSTLAPDIFYRINDVDCRPDGTFGMIYTTYQLLGSDTIVWYCMNYSIVSNSEMISDITILPSLVGYPGIKSLCHDSDGNAYVSSYRKMGEYYNVCYLTNADCNWTATDVAYGGNSSSFDRYGTGTDITVGFDGSIYIGYFAEDFDGEKTNHTVRYCTNSGGTWGSHVIEGCRGWLMKESIAIITDQNQDIHVVYYNGQSYHSVYTTSLLNPDRFKLAAYDSLSLAAFSGFATAVAVLLMLRRVRKRRLHEERIEKTGSYDNQ